jgi:hypothetical protein
LSLFLETATLHFEHDVVLEQIINKIRLSTMNHRTKLTTVESRLSELFRYTNPLLYKLQLTYPNARSQNELRYFGFEAGEHF